MPTSSSTNPKRSRLRSRREQRSPQQLNKLVKVQIVDQRAGVASGVGSAFAAGVVLFAGKGVVEGDVAGRADDAGVAGFAGDEEGF